VPVLQVLQPVLAGAALPRLVRAWPLLPMSHSSWPRQNW
jgi:hypothetical protein